MASETPRYPGCSDGGCIFGHPGGMHTNGGCHCLPSLSEMRSLTPSERLGLREKIRAQSAEVKRLYALWVAAFREREAHHSASITAFAEASRMRAALEEFGDHKAGCPYDDPLTRDSECRCGYQAACARRS